MQALLTLAASAGITEWVVCPSTPLLERCAEGLSGVKRMRSWSTSSPALAASFALGRMQAAESPIALLVASEQLAAMLPLIEVAQQQCRSLFILSVGDTASLETSARIYSGDDLDESSLYTSLQAGKPLLLTLTESFIEEQLEAGFPKKCPMPAELPAPAFRGSLVQLSSLLRFRYHEGIVLAIGALDESEREPILWFAETLRAPAVVDACSGLREELDSLRLSCPELLLEQSLTYHLVRIGDFSSLTEEKQELWKKVAAHGRGEVFDLSRTGASPLNEESKLVIGELEQVMKALGDVPQIGDVLTILPSSRQREGKLEELALSDPTGEAAAIFNLSQYASLAQSITLADSHSHALWDEHAQHQHPMHHVLRASEKTGLSPLAQYLGSSLDENYSCCLLSSAALESLDTQQLGELPALLAQLPEAHRVIVLLARGLDDGLREKLATVELDKQVKAYDVDDLDELNNFTEGDPSTMLLELC